MNDPISLARQTDAKQKIKAASLPLNSDEPTAGIRVTRAQFAKMMGCSRQAVTEWVRAGRLTVGSDGRFDPRAAVASLLRTGDPARLRARVLQPLAAELQALRGRIVDLEAALGQALRTIETERTERERMIDEAVEFHEGAAAELLDIFEALREQIATAWPVLSELPENAGPGIVIGWLDSALQVGPERAGPILAALAESGEGGEGVQDERGEA
jgi:hypothetical protein